MQAVFGKWATHRYGHVTDRLGYIAIVCALLHLSDALVQMGV